MGKYGIVSDTHCHSWSQFSKIQADGVNSRLRVILEELIRAAVAVKDAGGDTLRVAGDLFHVRGRIEPSVFNPTFDAFEHIVKTLGIKVEIIPGNHDLEGATTDSLGNAMQQLQRLDGVTVVTETLVTPDCVLIPWIEKLDDLRAEMKKHADKNKDLIIHAPVNGVVKGLPDHGLEPDELAQLGYRRVFAGHYHNHKSFAGGKVYSIGATTHQTWSDSGSQAGFLLVDDKEVEFHPTKAPLFVTITDETEITSANLQGHYARLKLVDAEEDVLRDARKALDAAGALGWVDHSSKKRKITRLAQQPAAGAVKLEVSVANFVAKELDACGLSRKKIALDALDVLRQARTMGNE